MKAARLKDIVLRLGVAALLVLMVGCDKKPRLSSNVELLPDLVYGLGYVGSGGDRQFKDLKLDVLRPTDLAGVLKPAVLVIHGGSFTGGTKTDEDLVQYADGLATRGYVCFLSDYRLTGDDPPAPGVWSIVELGSAVHAAAVDAKTALRYIRANSSTFEIDLDRITIMGDSAGAIAALAAGLSDEEGFATDGTGYPAPPENNPGIDAKPRAIINFWGSADLFLSEFSADDPAIMVVHGSNDLTVGLGLEPALVIVSLCEDFDIPYRFYPLWGEGHGPWDAEVNGMNLVELSETFLEDYVY